MIKYTLAFISPKVVLHYYFSFINEIFKLMHKDQDQKNQKSKCVKVAIRIRPMISKELSDAETTCIRTQGRDTVLLGRDRQFRFNRVFDEKSLQEEVYTECVEELVQGLLEGYNSTVLAYGQTGSGKTFTMGTNLGYAATQQQLGILPRVIRRLFEQVELKRNTVDFTIKASFLEIYNEQILDLLASDSRNLKNRLPPSIIEEGGNINILGLTEDSVSTTLELMSILQKGSLQRSTAQTLMNDSSSRSHAIFTITVRQDIISDQQQNKGSISSKFHFVDLAGSQRLKKTGATGSTLRQGISINLGLLSLGNVINALTNTQNKNHFIPYRDSKLTRILQDSLGGNSNTYMLACVSPAQSNYEQSLSTLKYAARAMNIKNKPVVNRDPQSALIAQLKAKVYDQQKENERLRGMLKDAGIKVEEPVKDSNSCVQSFHHMMSMQDKEQMLKLKQQHKSLERKVQQQSADLILDRKKLNELQIQLLEMRRDRDLLRMHLDEILKENPNLVIPDITVKSNTLEQYTQQIQELRIALSDKQRLAASLQSSYESLQQSTKHDQQIILNHNKQIYKLKRQIIDLYKLRSKYQKNDVSQDNSRISHDVSRINQISRISMTDRSQIIDNDHDFEQVDDSQVKLKEGQLQKQNTHTNEQLSEVNKVLGEKEQELREMTNNQIDLEYRLITQMKQEYYNKIKALEIEKQKLQKEIHKQKDDSGKSSINPTKDKIVASLKAKRQLLENQLKQYKKREKEQQNLEKLVESQKNKIGSLSNEIKSFKQQKSQLNKRIKQDKERFQKFRLNRMKQVFNIKRKNIEKDYQIRKLTNENRKAAQYMMKKDQQTKRLKKANDTLKQILQPKNRPINVRTTYRSTITTSNISHQQSVSSQPIIIQYDVVVNKILTLLACDLDLEAQINKFQVEIENIENQLLKYNEKHAKLRMEHERFLMREDYQENKKVDQQIKLQETMGILENLEQNLQYARGRQKDLMSERRFDLDTQLLYNKSYESVQVMRKFLKLFIQKTAAIIQEQLKGKQTINQLKAELESTQNLIQEKEQQLQMLNVQHQQNLYKLREELLFRVYAPDDINETQQTQKYINKTITEDKGFEKKMYDRKIQDLTKKVKQLGMQLDHSKRKYQVVFQKYESIKKLSAKDKFIGRNRQQEQIKLTTFKEKRMEKTANTSYQNLMSQINSQNLEQVSSLMQNSSFNPNQNVSVRSQRRGQEMVDTNNILDEGNFMDKFQWECISRLQGHSNPILSMACHSNMLISTSIKSLKLWDLQTNKVISDLSGIHLNGFVKHVVVEPQRRIMVTCCDKNVTLWDLVSLQVISTLKGHKDEVRVLHIKDNLYSGGKGGPSAGSIFAWDFRSNNFLYQCERNQDVFSFASNQETLFYGSRNHQVRRLSLPTMQGMAPFQPPHLDMVTCMIEMGGYLISGSKDKHLKLWDLQQPVNNLKNTSYAHNDYVNTIQAMPDLPIFYSGSRNGQVKVGTISQQKINFLANIDCHSQSVNALSVFDDSQESMFATGSSDKLIKIWRPSKDTLKLFMNSQQFQQS